MFCPNCGYQTDGNFCPRCGTQIKTDENKKEKKSESDEILDEVLNRFRGKKSNDVNSLHLKDLVINVLKRHSKEETEKIFISGTTMTTPNEWEIQSTWQKPWLYSRILLFMAATYFILQVMLLQFSNQLMIPGVIFVGSLAVPLALLIFFFEANAPRNISIFNVMKMFFLGGCASLLVTLVLFGFVDVSGNLSYGEAITVGIVEELGKLVIVALFVKMVNPKYILNGILIGAAIGAGFSVFESSGYAFVFFVNNRFDLSIMFEIIHLRGFLAAGGHIIWAAMSGGALCLVKKNRVLEPSMLFNIDFLKLFAVPVVLHSIWDMPLPQIGSQTTIPIILTVVGWGFILTLIDKGLKQISNIGTYQTTFTEK